MTKRRFILKILDSRIQSFSPASAKRFPMVLKNMHVVWKAPSLSTTNFRRSELTGFERIFVALPSLLGPELYQSRPILFFSVLHFACCRSSRTVSFSVDDTLIAGR